ncbi:Cation efflux protein [Penicillium fimorum]|uniref:Cation efflux protein n=1 Tax=Penicillium fimorum TaxID=1882269 RepID=A0A9W9XUY9_9EURO|nr:Cation efflux protein [Penicillium fimorum]
MVLHLSRSTRLSVVIGISTCFFLAEISLGFYTHSIALIADAFHYLNDLVGFVIALVALKKSERRESPKELTFGWQRAQLLGAFFNGVLLFGLGISIFLQSIERFIALQRGYHGLDRVLISFDNDDVHNPKLMFIIGCVGLGLNIISAVFLHGRVHEVVYPEHGHGHGHDHGVSPTIETPVLHLGEECHDSSTKHHDHKHLHFEKHHCADSGGHSHGHGGHDHGDLGMMGVMIHVIGDAINNLGVMAAGLVIWLAAPHAGRYYADPGVSMFIAILIILSSFPLMRRAGMILLESVPTGVDMCDVKHDLEKIKGVNSIHELHIWRLNQQKTLASVHVVVSDNSVEEFMKTARVINECFHAYGIHSITMQPELSDVDVSHESRCQVICGTPMVELTRLHLPWSSGDDFRLSLIPISAGDRGSIPRGRDFIFATFQLFNFIELNTMAVL